ncbi:MAG: hypothetical protein K6U80_06385 [Firmicutes bacterium]|nr:hypothetical protein [Bacillota bacterium]
MFDDDDFFNDHQDSFELDNSTDTNLTDDHDSIFFEDGTETDLEAILQLDSPDSPELTGLNHHAEHEDTGFTHRDDNHTEGDHDHYHEVFTGKSGHSDITFKGGLGICGIQCLNGCTSILTEDNQNLSYSELSEHNS